MLRSTGWAGAIKRTTLVPRAGSIPSERDYPAALNKEEVAAWAGYALPATSRTSRGSVSLCSTLGRRVHRADAFGF